MTLNAYAKINLTLDITGVRENGYHDIDTVMQSITLYDEITLTKNKEGIIRLTCSRMSLPLDQRNTAYQAAKLLLEYGGVSDMGVNIHLTKVIPSQAGLGGGSADAAAVLLGINTLFCLNVPTAQLLKLAVKIGADVPFCLLNGTRRCMGIGEQMETVPTMPNCTLLICKPEVGVRTADAYLEADKYPQEGEFFTQNMVTALRAGTLTAVADAIGNRFDDILHVPEVQIIKSLMMEAGALNASMTGSGSAVFGIFASLAQAQQAAECLRAMGHVFLAEPMQ